MDANGSRYYLLLNADDWARCRVDGVPLANSWSASPPEAAAPLVWQSGIGALTFRPLLFRFMTAPADVRPALGDRRGAAADRFGNFYWIDEDGRGIRIRSTGSGDATPFWPGTAAQEPERHGDFSAPPPAPSAPPVLRGLTVTEDHYLVVGTVEPKGVLIFDLFSGGPPTQLFWPQGVPFEPFDMAPRSGGGAWILDRENRRYWALDRRFNVVRDEQAETMLSEESVDTFQPPPPEPSRMLPRRVFPAGIEYDAASPVEATDAVAIESLPDGSVLILDRNVAAGFSRILHYRFAHREGTPVSLSTVSNLVEEGEREDFTLVAHDFVFLPAGMNGEDEGAELIVASSEGNQAFGLRLTLRDEQLVLEPLAKYFPMRRFGGKALVRSARTVYYDFADGWIPLAAQRRPRYATHAELETRQDGFDSGTPDCVWHRLMLDASIPPECSVQVWSRAAEDAETLVFSEWRREPPLYRRSDGSELPWVERVRAQAGRDEFGTWELLLQQARGRLLQLRLVIDGNERDTPRIRAVRIWYPRFSYATRYLPAVYRDDPVSGSFLERFLANFEGVFTALEDRIAGVQALFDFRSAPADALDWLARWFDASLDPAWDERRRRMFIAHAVEFFQFRGTIQGLRMALALAFDPGVEDCELEAPSRIPESRQRFRVIERFLTRRTPGRILGEPMRDTGPREVSAGARWRPSEGAARIGERYADYVERVTGTRPEPAEFALLPPSGDEDAARWAAFAEQVLGFVPAAAEDRSAWQQFLAGTYADEAALNLAHESSFESFSDVPLPRDVPTVARARDDWREFAALGLPRAVAHTRKIWQDFLARRYRRIAALNAAWHTAWARFEDVSIYDRLPQEGAALADWYQFEAVIRPMHRSAHRFSVLIPATSTSAGVQAVQQRLPLARRILELQKPAHTVFDVGFYWAMFRIGEARIGFDTLIDVGSRAPQFMPAMVLDEDYIGASHLAPPPGHPLKERLTLECIPVTA